MGAFLDPKTTHLGWRLKVWRDTLLTWRLESGQSPWKIAGRARVGLSPFEVFAILDECQHQNLIGPDTESDLARFGLGLTDRGQSLTRSQALRPTPRNKADATISDLIRRISRLNADPTYPFTVTRLWLCGDYLDPTASSVAHVDLSFEIADRSTWTDRQIRAAYRRLGWEENLAASHDALEETVRRRAIYDGQRPVHLRQFPFETLVESGMARRCVYDAERGKIVEADCPAKADFRMSETPWNDAVPDFSPARGYRVIRSHWFAADQKMPLSTSSLGPWTARDAAYADVYVNKNPARLIAQTRDLEGLRPSHITDCLRMVLEEMPRDERDTTFAIVCGRTDHHPDPRKIPVFTPSSAYRVSRFIEETPDQLCIVAEIFDILAPRPDDLAANRINMANVAWILHACHRADRVLVSRLAVAQHDSRPVTQAFRVGPTHSQGRSVESVLTDLLSHTLVPRNSGTARP